MKNIYSYIDPMMRKGEERRIVVEAQGEFYCMGMPKDIVKNLDDDILSREVIIALEVDKILILKIK